MPSKPTSAPRLPPPERSRTMPTKTEAAFFARFALTRGIEPCRIKHDSHGRSLNTGDECFTLHASANPRWLFTSREDAVKYAEGKRDEEIAKLERELERLRALKF